MSATMDLGNLIIHLKADIAQYERQMKEARQIMQSTARQLTSMGMKMSLAVTAPLAAVAASAVKTFGTFDAAMTKSLAVMGDVSGEMRADMEQLAIQLSTESVTAAHELAGAYEYLALAGLDAQKQLKALPEVNKFAIAGAFDLATATDLLTDAQDALGMSSKNTNEHIANMKLIADSVAVAASNANDTIQGFGTMLTSDAGVAARMMNMELKTTLAILSSYAAQGIKSAHAGNMFGRSVRLLTQAARDNAEVWKRMGVETVDTVTGEYRNFIDILADLEKIMVKLTAPERARLLQEMGFEALAQKSILPLIGMTAQMKEWEQTLSDVGGTVEDMAEDQMSAFNAQLKITWNNVQAAAREIGAVLAPSLMKVNELVKQAAQWWRGLSVETKKLIVDTALITAAIGPALIMVGKLIKAVLFLTGSITLLTGVVAGAAAAFAGWQIGKWLVGEFEWVAQAGNDLASALMAVWEYIKFGFASMVAGIRMLWDGLLNKILGGSRDVGKQMFADAQTELEQKLEAIGQANAIIQLEIAEKFAAKQQDKEQEDVEDVVAKHAASVKGLMEDFDLDSLLSAGGGGLTSFGSGDVVGRLGLAGMTAGADNQLQNLAQQQLSETKRIAENTEAMKDAQEWS